MYAINICWLAEIGEAVRRYKLCAAENPWRIW
jgi:hypothetical protein